MEANVLALLDDFARRKAGAEIEEANIRASDPWDLEISFVIPGQGTFAFRNLREGDVPALLAFGDSLSPASRHYFAPYPWATPEELPEAFEGSIRQAVNRVDASYLMFHDGRPIGQFFLWKAGGNPHAQAHGLELPELGVAFADAYQGRGLGALAVRFLVIVARALGQDGVELTTALDNQLGWNTYLRAGFEHVGNVFVPQAVDVTAVLNGEVTAERWREERLMIHVLNEAKRQVILDYLHERQELCAKAARGATIV